MPFTLRIGRQGDAGRIRQTKCRRVRRAIGHSGGRPIRCDVPISAAGVKVPSRAGCVEDLDAQHEDERQGEKFPYFHSKHLSGATDSFIHG